MCDSSGLTLKSTIKMIFSYFAEYKSELFLYSCKWFEMLFLLGLSNLPRIIIACDFSSSSFKLKKGTLPLLQNRYPNLKTTSHINLRFFL